MLLLLFTTILARTAYRDQYENITTLFSQGMWASRSQAAKYTREGVMVEGQLVTYSGANDIVYNVLEYPELRQVGTEWSFNPLYILMQCVTYLRSWYYWSWGEVGYHVHVSRIDVAGATEVAEHREAWMAQNWKLDKQHRRQLVLFGTSRGADTTLISVAISHPYERRHLRLVVLEAPFDSVEHALKYRWGSDMGQLVFDAMRQWTNYSDTAMTPVMAAWHFPLDVPVLFITSAADTVVHRNQTRYLIDILKTRKHPAVHHLELEHSSHWAMSLGNGEDQIKYTRFMAQMYSRYVLGSPECPVRCEPCENIDARVIVE
jgi:hypothetical protein